MMASAIRLLPRAVALERMRRRCRRRNRQGSQPSHAAAAMRPRINSKQPPAFDAGIHNVDCHGLAAAEKATRPLLPRAPFFWPTTADADVLWPMMLGALHPCASSSKMIEAPTASLDVENTTPRMPEITAQRESRCEHSYAARHMPTRRQPIASRFSPASILQLSPVDGRISGHQTKATSSFPMRAARRQIPHACSCFPRRAAVGVKISPLPRPPAADATEKVVHVTSTASHFIAPSGG